MDDRMLVARRLRLLIDLYLKRDDPEDGDESWDEEETTAADCLKAVGIALSEPEA